MEDLEAVNLAADWADISQGLRKDLGHQLHSQWIKPIQVGGFTDDTGTLELYLPTDFSANWVKDRFHDRLSLAWKIARGEVRQLRICVHPGRRKLPELSLGDAAPIAAGPGLVASDLTRETSAAPDEDLAAVSAAEQAFAAQLYRVLAVDEGNLVFSPLSIHLALAMALGGAGGETATEMEAAPQVAGLDAE